MATLTAVAELERTAQAIVPPVSATGWRLTVTGATDGGRTGYAVVPIIDCRRDGRPVYDGSQADCSRMYDLLTGRALRSAPRSAAPRSQAEGPAERGAVRSVRSHERSNPPLPDVAGAGAPGGRTTSETYPASGSPGAPLIFCKACGHDITDLPLPRNGQRRQTCDDACRQAYHRGQRAPVPGVVDAEDLDRLSRLPRPSVTGTDRAEADPARPGASQPALSLG